MANPHNPAKSAFTGSGDPRATAGRRPLHDGDQDYVSRFGSRPHVRRAASPTRSTPRAAPSNAIEPLMLWVASGKPVTPTAVIQLWERGPAGARRHPVAAYRRRIGEKGKERVRSHVLHAPRRLHMAAGGGKLFDKDLPYARPGRTPNHPADVGAGRRRLQPDQRVEDPGGG